MKKLFLLLLVSLSLVSCGSKDIQWKLNEAKWQVQEVKNQIDEVKTQADNAKAKVENVKEKTQEAKWIIQDTTDIINDYGDTLQWSVKDARSVKELYDSNNQKLQDDIRNAYK